MNTRLFSPFLAAAIVCLSISIQANAQEPVSTGVIQEVTPKTGTLTLRSDQTTRPITFYGMERANIFTADGKSATVTDLQPGMKVTVQYAERDRRWYISKVMLPEQPRPVVGAPVNADPALSTKAATDGDITTQPGSKAAIDNDITTQPASGKGSSGRAPVRRRGP